MQLAELSVRIGADMSGLTQGLRDAGKKFQGFGSKVEAFGSSLSGVGGAVTKGLGAPLLAAAGTALAASVSVGTFADELLDLVDQTGLSAESLQEFRHVARVAGVDSDALAKAAIKLTTGLSGTGEESKTLEGAMQKLGISLRDSTGKLRPMEEIFPSIIEKLQGMEDTTARNALAGDIFGKSWAEIAPILALGAGGMEEAREEARKLGLVMSRDALEKADQFRRGMDTLTAQLGAAKNELGVALIPVLTQFGRFLESKILPAAVSLATKISTAVQWFSKLSPAVQTTIGVTAGLAVAMGPLLVAAGALVTALPLIKLGFAALTGPIGLTVAAIGALTTVWLVWGDDIKAVAKDTVAKVTQWFNGLTNPFTKVSEGIEKVTSAFRTMWNKVVGHSYVPDMVNGVIVEFTKMGNKTVQETLSLTGAVTKYFEGLKGKTLDDTEVMRSAIAEKFLSMGTSVKTSTADMVQNVARQMERLHNIAGEVTVGISTKFGMQALLMGEAAQRQRAELRRTQEEFLALGGTLSHVEVKMATSTASMAGNVSALGKALDDAGGMFRQAGSKTLSFIGDVGKKLLGMFNPLNIVATMLDQAFRATAETMKPLMEIAGEIAVVLADALRPVIESLVPIFRALAPVIGAVGRSWGRYSGRSLRSSEHWSPCSGFCSRSSRGWRSS